MVLAWITSYVMSTPIEAFYYINCSVIQGFPAPRKAETSTREKKLYFFTYVDIANHLLTRHRLWRHWVRLINERQSLHDSQYKLFVGAFSNYGD